jgi:hypothetical protein
VFKLLKLLIGTVALGAFAWFGLTVPLGDRTLYGHITAIGHSKESRELVRGTKEKVGDLKRRIAGGEAQHEKPEKPEKKKADKVDKAENGANSEKAEPQERLTNIDRKEIRHFIDGARAKISKSN